MDTTPELRISPTRGAMTVGAATAALMLVVSLVGWQIAGWIVFVGGIFYGMRIYKRVLGGIIVYSKSLNVGCQTAFFASLIMAFVGYVSTTFEPSLITSMLDVAEQQMKTSGFPEGLVDAAVQQWRGILTPMVFGVMIIFMYSTVGCFASIILAFFVRNAKPGEFVEY